MAPMHSHTSDLDLLHQLADDATAAILPHFRALPEVDNKASEGFDPVTVADRAAEAAMRERLAAARPDDGILGEEYERTHGTSGRTWVIDPIDGTRGFMAGLPTWGVLIALYEGNEARLGMMAQPFVDERFFATAQEANLVSRSGAGPLRTRRCGALRDAVVAHTSTAYYDAALRTRFDDLAGKVRLVRSGVDCYGYALLAAGHIDVVVETGLKPFDIAPFVTIVEAAGGVLVNRSGARVGPAVLADFDGDAIAVGDPSLVDEVLAALG